MNITFRCDELGAVDIAEVPEEIRKTCRLALQRRWQRSAEFRAAYRSLDEMLATLRWEKLRGVEVDGAGRTTFDRIGYRATDAKLMFESMDYVDQEQGVKL